MGNCCGKKSTTAAFQGEGRRLGSAADEEQPLSTSQKYKDEKLPKPRKDPKLTATERDALREERLAAAEARQKKNQGTKPKKKATDTKPLKGPNSQPLMRWTAG